MPSILLSAHHDNPRLGKLERETKKRGDKNEGDNSQESQRSQRGIMYIGMDKE